jgi:hypothetical protein
MKPRYFKCINIDQDCVYRNSVEIGKIYKSTFQSGRVVFIELPNPADKVIKISSATTVMGIDKRNLEEIPRWLMNWFKIRNVSFKIFITLFIAYFLYHVINAAL